ncbi:hypothetical protein G7092_06230 [Mucilaginibacter sp. HC2]|uniref:hypothetical protein n=1 Tax=Mucilaginibacter inviolabilis TaxID=2714892 RepID=UPI00140DB688|nr:hypothetical protein [Mucilaginibacter inviolabilis]NHA03380.1 hypothetical protein [Mucilaginibacter inviolabilis]
MVKDKTWISGLTAMIIITIIILIMIVSARKVYGQQSNPKGLRPGGHRGRG